MIPHIWHFNRLSMKEAVFCVNVMYSNISFNARALIALLPSSKHRLLLCFLETPLSMGAHSTYTVRHQKVRVFLSSCDVSNVPTKRLQDPPCQDRNRRLSRLRRTLWSTQMPPKYPCSRLGRDYTVDTTYHWGIRACFMALWVCRSWEISHRPIDGRDVCEIGPPCRQLFFL